MGVGSWFRRQLGRPTAAPAEAPTRRGARYDAAQNTEEHRKHWERADQETARDANDRGTRATLRVRSKYETDNNGFLNGLVRQLANDLIGTGPRPQFTIPGVARARARAVEREYRRWAKTAGVARKLRTAERSRVVKGEAFPQLTTNPKLKHPVKLDLFLVGADRVCTPLIRADDPLQVDGIRFDEHGNPVEYHVLKRPINDALAFTLDYDRIPAARMLHWYRQDEEGQWRGVPETSPTLLVGAQVRRLGKAVLTAAEISSLITGILKTNAAPPVAPNGDPAAKAMAEVEFVPGTFLQTPSDWEAKAFESKQPFANYTEFVDHKLNETSRPHLAPKNLITGDSSGFNFASGKLDGLPYHAAVWINRHELEERVLDPMLDEWLREAELVAATGRALDGLFAGLPPVAEWEIEWHYDGFASIDPFKEANATEKLLGLNLTTLAEECAARGLDWEDVLVQRAKELKRIKELEAEYGVTFATPAKAAAPAPARDREDDEEEVPASVA